MTFDDFYAAERAPMVGLARTICGNHETACDIAQEAMSRAYENWSTISAYERPGAWLRRVTINLAISGRRRRSRELTILRRTAQERPRHAVHADDRPDDAIWQAVQQLPPRQRAVIGLFYQDDLSTSDIADILGCTVSTATSHLSQARSSLAAALAPDRETSTAQSPGALHVE